jgi:cysteine synthase B
LESLSSEKVEVFAKLEWLQLSASVKARTAWFMLDDALRHGKLRKGMQILEATSGNTGIALASLAARLQIPITLYLPENASRKRKQILRALGANLELTDPLGGTDVAQEEALKVYQKKPDAFWYADQYSNPANIEAHIQSTGPEILGSIKPTHFITALGTSGTFSGISMYLRRILPGIQTIALEPDSPLHGLEGWKHMETARVPAIWNPAQADEIRAINSYEAFQFLEKLSSEEGLLLSPSSAANALGAAQLAEQIRRENPEQKARIVTIFPDRIDKYDEVLENLNS